MLYSGRRVTSLLMERLNKILPRLISQDFLCGRGIGNEIGFYIFEYPPESELQIRQYLASLLPDIAKEKPDLRIKHINLFDFILEYLASRNLLEKALKMQQEKGDEALQKALSAPLHESKLAPLLAEEAQPDQHDLILISGIGSAWPLLRTHTLLSNLHPMMGPTPLVMFYPGYYDGQSLRLFGKLKNNNYYRAFKLIPH